MPVLTLLFLAMAAFGHAAFWVGAINRWHGTGFPRVVVKGISLVFYTALVVPPAWAVWHGWRYGWSVPVELPSPLGDWPVRAYLVLCASYGIFHLATWIIWRLRSHPPMVEIGPNHVVDLAERLGSPPAVGLRTRLFSLVPGNQVWQLHVGESTVSIPGLDPALQGLSVCHWSDLHLSGRIDRGYFRELVSVTNERPADLLALTGDVCDRARYIDWIVDLFGGLEARLGKYFILGNHDLRTRAIGRLRATLCEAGFTDLGGRTLAIDGGRILLAGDERPWFRGEPELPLAGNADPRAVRILMAHTPDRLAWARARHVDLMLAGHTHGGQIRFPLVGAVVCPSLFGTKYDAGFYHAAPTTLHVSRGSASLFPLRLGCPPEITRLVLRSVPV